MSKNNIQKVMTPQKVTQSTEKVYDALLNSLPFSDQEDFEDARKGFIATVKQEAIKGADGRIVWDLASFQFLGTDQVPATVNPSLWRQAQLNAIHGLFQVSERIYQIRGLDVSNMTIIEGDTGLIIIDPLLSAECAKAGIELYYQHVARKPIQAILYTHSHVDHFGGARGIVSEEDLKANKIRILAPEGFLEHAVSENVYVGNAMSRRSQYQYGPTLSKNAQGLIDIGLGKTVSIGELTLIPPTETIKETGESRTIDGVEMVFQMAHETEAPSEFLIFFPQFRALCAAEDMTHTLHNLYTLRGAEVRNAAAWWKTINDAIYLFGDQIDTVFAQHHWPMWGQEQIREFFEKQRDLYKYIHDQTLRLINHGYTMLEVADMVQLPPSLANKWYNRGYYGTVNHNVKAIYQKYLGFYSSNPADLHPYPPQEAGKRYVDFMGGAAVVIKKARESFAQGDFRWVVEVMKHVVFSDPSNQEAKSLQADAMEQLGYQAECGTWRNEYLVGAFELRNGIPQLPTTSSVSPDMFRAMTLPMCFDFLGIRLNGPRAEGLNLKLNWIFTDIKEQFALQLKNCALTYTANKQFDKPDTTLTMTRQTFDEINLQQLSFDQAITSGRIKVEGNQKLVEKVFSLLDTFDLQFSIVTP